MGHDEWAAAMAALPTMARNVAGLPLDTDVTIYLSGGAVIRGDVNETDTPECLELLVFSNPPEYARRKLTGRACVDVRAVIGFNVHTSA